MIPTIYRGSVKDVRGPVRYESVQAVVFEYTDAYSVFDWGRMPDLLPHKGEALAVLAAEWFEKLERFETWRDFSRAPEALALRKANPFGAAFNDVGERLQREGLKSHYLGLLSEAADARPSKVRSAGMPFRHLAVRRVTAVKPELVPVMGRVVPDYLPTRSSAPPRLVPLEVVFRFSCPEGSSLLERVSRSPEYMASLGYPNFKVGPGEKWDFPVLELFTKLEPTDRPVGLSEALAISGISAAQLQELMLKTAWVAGWLRSICSRSGLELADGKLEWGVSETGEIFLVDAIGPDELRILKGDVQLSKEFLRGYYRTTPWYSAIGEAKKQAKAKGVAEWKMLVAAGPPTLPAAYRELASQIYMALTNQLSGRVWFQQAWKLDQVIEELQKIPGSSA